LAILPPVNDVEKTKVGLFAFYCFLTIVSGVLSFTPFDPAIRDGLAFTAAVIGGAIILYGSIRSLLDRDFTVDLLASIAIIVSIMVGQYLAAAIVVVMLNGGELVEEYAEGKASQALEKLLRSTPITARVRREGQDVDVPVEKVTVGDRVLVKPGEKIPVDGIVAMGDGSVNQAAITGESLPVSKTRDSDVYSNTLLEDGVLEIRVTKAPNDTVFAHIVQLVRDAQANRAPIIRLADKYARWFAPLILTVAVLTWLVTGDPLATAAVLVVSCPCALTLATPIAIVASMGNAAKHGMLIRNGASLEEISKSDVVIVDKTGTLTLGEPEIVDVKGFNGHALADVLQLAMVAEKFSEHSIAKAILTKGTALGITATDPDAFTVRTGHGVVAMAGNDRILVGNRTLFHEHDVPFEQPIDAYYTAQEHTGGTAMGVALNADVVGIITVADTVRRNVAQSLADLKRNGVKRVVMLTGDNRVVAARIAQQTAIDDVHAELLPDEKGEYVKTYQKNDTIVTMIGDGINDAPALATADIGIAMGIAGTDVAMETAGIILTTDDLSKVSQLIRLSRNARSIIKQNVIFSLAVNVIGLFLSTQGLVSPIIASVIHESSALLVVFNSLRLTTKKL
jgi:heavy metal translocating P-type ATPase